MPESPDPLRSLFQHAAAVGARQASPAPVAHITDRGRRRHRRRLAVAAAGVCLAMVGGGAAGAALVTDRSSSETPAPGSSSAPRRPATSPTTRPAPSRTAAHTSSPRTDTGLGTTPPPTHSAYR
ncbi:hypothetical protein Athai_48470 [Actinocatenispora thailandica]|uniref:Uncharacterized protein n=1 Tax=Actinocatenispora thailandica TaxID=227318 RepID=A0A7R7DT48_9ACTN|nr:hypothetical protein [Actinocatenispora thailandica]BCJ37344.1 hypothetical protein Athai_48470 [Actinocatenispora thailandica]